jgi:hypothetical protein
MQTGAKPLYTYSYTQVRIKDTYKVTIRESPEQFYLTYSSSTRARGFSVIGRCGCEACSVDNEHNVAKWYVVALCAESPSA